MKILCSVPKRFFYVCYISRLFQLQVLFLFFVQWIDLGSKTPLQAAHSGFQDIKFFGTIVWGGSLDFNLQSTNMNVQFLLKVYVLVVFFCLLTICGSISFLTIEY